MVYMLQSYAQKIGGRANAKLRAK